MDLERHNDRQIEGLNQRGGRTLSIVDLLRAGTLDVSMAAYAMRAMHEGTSLLSGARPGGAGKTTLMAALLNLLPPGVPIVTVDHSRVIVEGLSRPADEPACYLAHEMGSGSWYGYIWGHNVADFLSLIEGQRRIASCLHADTLEELTEIVCAPPLSVSPAALGRVGLILFIHVTHSGGRPQRRVAAFWEADGSGRHRLVFRWNPSTDSFLSVGKLRQPEQLAPYQRFLQSLLDRHEVDTEAVRRSTLDFYERESR
jgi:hypothetical protein